MNIKKAHKGVAILSSMILLLQGCGTMTGIPSHGGGKRFSVEQRLVSSSIRAALKSIDISALRSHKVALIFDFISDEGGGNLQGGRMSLGGAISAGQVFAPVTSTTNQFQIFDLVNTGTNFSNTLTSSSGLSTATTSTVSNTTGTSTSTNTGTAITTGSDTTNSTGTDTTNSSGTVTNNAIIDTNGGFTTSDTTNSTITTTPGTVVTTTTGGTTTTQTPSGSDVTTSNSTNNGSGTNTSTTTEDSTSTSTGLSTTNTSATIDTTSNSTTDTTSNGTDAFSSDETTDTTSDNTTTNDGTADTTGGSTQSTQTVASAPSRTETRSEGARFDTTSQLVYRGLGDYSVLQVPKSDASLFMGLTRNYLLLNGIPVTSPQDEEATAIVYVTIDIFGLNRSRFDAIIINKERVVAEAALEMFAFDREGKMIMKPTNSNYTARYNETYLLWVGPFESKQKVNKGDGLLVDFSDVDENFKGADTNSEREVCPNLTEECIQ